MDAADSAPTPRRNPARWRSVAPAALVAASIGIACLLATPRPPDGQGDGDGDGAPAGDPGADGKAPTRPGPVAEDASAGPKGAAPGEGKGGAPTAADTQYDDEFVRRFRRAQQLFGGGKDAEAEKVFRELLAEQPDAAALHHAVAFVELHRGRREAALEGFLNAARLAPEDGSIRRDCGFHLVEAGRFQEAIAHLEAARRLVDADVETVCALGRALEATGDPAKGETAYRDALAIDSNSVDARALLARNLLGSRPAESLALLDGVPQSWVDVVEVKAMALERLGRWPDAATVWRRVVELAPGDATGVPGLRAASEGLVRCGDPAAAVEAATKWTARDRTPVPSATSGATGGPTAIADRPGYRASVCLATARAGTGDAAGALAALDAAAVPEKVPTPIQAHMALVRAHLLLAAGREDDAGESLATAAGLDAPFERAAALFLLGKGPIDAVRTAAGSDPARANDVEWIAWLGSRAAGDAAGAAEHLSKARAATRPPGEHPGMLLPPRTPEPAPPR